MKFFSKRALRDRQCAIRRRLYITAPNLDRVLNGDGRRHAVALVSRTGGDHRQHVGSLTLTGGAT